MSVVGWFFCWLTSCLVCRRGNRLPARLSPFHIISNQSFFRTTERDEQEPLGVQKNTRAGESTLEGERESQDAPDYREWCLGVIRGLF